MASEAKETVLEVLRREQKAFFELVADPKNWNVQTRGVNWEVRDLVGHMIDVTESYLARWHAAEKHQEPGALGLEVMAQSLDDHALAFRKMSREQSLDRLRKDWAEIMSVFELLTPDEWTGLMITHPYMGPVPAGFYSVFSLMEYAVHAYDIRYGLGGKLAELDEITAGLLIPYCLIFLMYTVDHKAAKDLDFTYGIEVSGPWGGRWRAFVKDGKWESQPEPRNFLGCDALFKHTPSDFVLTVLGRFPGGSAAGDPEVIEAVRHLFFQMESVGWRAPQSTSKPEAPRVYFRGRSDQADFGPKDLPEPSHQLSQRMLGRVGGDEDDLDWEQRRSAIWTAALSDQLAGLRSWTKLPGYLFTGVGFVDFPTVNSPFGAVVYVQRPDGRATRADAHQPPTVIGYLIEDSRPFPIYLREVRYRPQGPTIAVRGGRTSCWAISRRQSVPIGPAVLTAGHVAAQDRNQPNPPIGQTVPMVDETTGRVVDVAPGGIDVALVTSDELPVTDKRLVIGEPRNWTDVTFTSSSHVVKTKIRQVFDLAGLRRSALFPERVLLAHAGADGDSGSVVFDNRGRAVAVYLAEAIDEAELHMGVATSMAQVRELMDLEVYG